MINQGDVNKILNLQDKAYGYIKRLEDGLEYDEMVDMYERGFDLLDEALTIAIGIIESIQEKQE